MVAWLNQQVDRCLDFGASRNRRDRAFCLAIAIRLIGWSLTLSSLMAQDDRTRNQSPEHLPQVLSQMNQAKIPWNAPVLVQYPPPEIEIPYSVNQLQERLRRSSNDFAAHSHLMYLYAQQGKWELSLHHALRARQIDDSDINVHLGIAYSYANLGRYQEAEVAIQTALRLPFDNLSRSALQRVRGDLAMDQHFATLFQGKSSWLAKARSAYQQALRLDAHNIQAMVGMARVEIALDNYPSAQRWLRRALAKVDVNVAGGRRKKALVLYYLGVVEELQGRRSKAKSFYQQAKSCHPQSFQSETYGELLLPFILIAITRESEKQQVAPGEGQPEKRHIKAVPPKKKER